MRDIIFCTQKSSFEKLKIFHQILPIDCPTRNKSLIFNWGKNKKQNDQNVYEYIIIYDKHNHAVYVYESSKNCQSRVYFLSYKNGHPYIIIKIKSDENFFVSLPNGFSVKNVFPAVEFIMQLTRFDLVLVMNHFKQQW